MVKNDEMAWRFLRGGGRRILARRAELTVTGGEYLPDKGPALIAARHYHHLLDGCALFATINRPAHIVVGLDWITTTAVRMTMDKLCAMARWPVVLRPDALDRGPTLNDPEVRQRREHEGRVLLREAARQTVTLLREGRIVIVFPEGYPNIDPGYTPKQGDDFLPFQPGFLQLARIAARSNAVPVPIVPAGFHYAKLDDADRWQITLRFGAPLDTDALGDERTAVARIEEEVKRLSAADEQV